MAKKDELNFENENNMASFLNSIDDEKKAVMKMEIRYKKAESEREIGRASCRERV